MKKETVVIEYDEYIVSENNGNIAGYITISDELTELFMKADHYHKDNIITLVPKSAISEESDIKEKTNRLFFVLKLK